jgi:hypothetical protein
MHVPRHLTRVTTNLLLGALLLLASGCSTLIEGAIDAAIYDTPEKRYDRAMMEGEPYYGPTPSSKKEGLRKSD